MASVPQFPLVSIIVPTFNYGYLIPDTLEDLLKQSYPHWECIIVDDGSKDDTHERVQPFIERDERFRYIFQQNQGLSAARNTGIRSAQGEFIQLLDSDDKLEHDKLRLHVAALEKDPGLDIVYGGVRYFTTDSPDLRLFDMKTISAKKTWMPCVSGKGAGMMSHFVRGNIMVVNAPVFRKRIIERVGFFDEQLRALEDWDFWVRCSLEGLSFKYTEEVGTNALVRSHLISMTRNDMLMYKANIIFREKLKVLLESRSDADFRKQIVFNNKELHKLYSETACEHIRNGDLVKGWKVISSMSFHSGYPSVYFGNGLRYTRKYFKKRLLNFLKGTAQA